MKGIVFIMVVLALSATVLAQKKSKVEGSVRPGQNAGNVKCATFTIGTIESMPAPKYPSEALNLKVGGVVEVTVTIAENGKVLEVEKIAGNSALHGAAAEAAMKARFSPTICNGEPARISGILSYNFIPLAPNERFFTAKSIDEFKDISKAIASYEAILDLTDNYKIAFGYGDRNYYPELPIPRGDFAHQLRLTLDFLKRQAEIAKVDSRNAFSDLNPKRITPENRIEFADPKAAFVDSIRTLLKDYNVSLFDAKNEFDGREAMRRGEIVAIWQGIFGEDAVPVNFMSPGTENEVVLRGEFAIFLQESLRVLTYKLLPSD
ncbi:MAG TPA: S-layer homology domain-containing protein [Pyrinomonadaceae bacterium]|nr:S-layer homology domain-containing protein [Pyrinomonadaceae bacterium]